MRLLEITQRGLFGGDQQNRSEHQFEYWDNRYWKQTGSFREVTQKRSESVEDFRSRNDEIMELSRGVDESRRSRQLHNRLRETHSLGAGATLTVNTAAEAQTVLNLLSYYSVEPATIYQRQCVEELSSVLYDHAPVSLAHVPIITDFLDENELRTQPDDLEATDEESTGRIEVDIAIKPGIDPHSSV